MKLLKYIGICLSFTLSVFAAEQNPFLGSQWDAHRLDSSIRVPELECQSERLKGMPICHNVETALAHAEKLFKNPLVIYFHNPDGTPSEEIRWGGSRTDTVTGYNNVCAMFNRAKNRALANLLPWCAFENNQGEFIGFIAAYYHQDEENYDSQYKGAIELIWVINPGISQENGNSTPNWNQGYASEALLSYINTYVSHLENYKYLWINTHPNNVASIKVALKIGMHPWTFPHADSNERPTYLRREKRIFFKIEKDKVENLLKNT